VGYEALQKIAMMLSHYDPNNSTNLIARYGGEEFVRHTSKQKQRRVKLVATKYNAKAIR